MELAFRTAKLEKTCLSERRCIQEWGPKRGRTVQRRLEQLAAAANLQTIGHLPPLKCHELKGSRKGTFAVNVDEAWRIVLEPALDPIPAVPDGGIDLARVTAIRILEVINYHGE